MLPRGEFRCHQEANSFSLLGGTGKSPRLSFAKKAGAMYSILSQLADRERASRNVLAKLRKRVADLARVFQ